MLQYIIVIGFFFVAIGVFAAGLTFSKYKKRDNSGCCGCDGGECGSSGCSEDGTGASCYNSKSRFVNEYVKNHS